MKLTVQRLLIFFLLIPLSIGFGFGYDAVATAVEKRMYPIPARYAPLIEEQAAEFGIPSAIVFAVVQCESDFVGDAVSEEGAIGLMQITPQQMSVVYAEIFHESAPDAGILYDPKTNLRIGTAWLSHLYRIYGVWDTVYAAWHAGMDATNAWLLDADVINAQGRLENIPEKSTAKFVSNAKKSEKMYTKLYFSAPTSES